MENIKRILEKRRRAMQPKLQTLVDDNLGVLNKLESHLGCAKCGGVLIDGRCSKCQPE